MCGFNLKIVVALLVLVMLVFWQKYPLDIFYSMRSKILKLGISILLNGTRNLLLLLQHPLCGRSLVVQEEHREPRSLYCCLKTFFFPSVFYTTLLLL